MKEATVTNFVPFVKSVSRTDEDWNEKNQRKKRSGKLACHNFIEEESCSTLRSLLSLPFSRASGSAEDDEIGQAVDNDERKNRKRLLVVFGPGSKADVRTS